MFARKSSDSRKPPQKLDTDRKIPLEPGFRSASESQPMAPLLVQITDGMPYYSRKRSKKTSYKAQ